MRAPPVEVILSWPPPNYDNPETRGPANQIVALALLGIATVLLAIRIYARRYISNGFGWDDILIILASIPATAFVVLGVIASQKFGWGRHVWDMPAWMRTASLQVGLACQILFDLATSLTKLSMLALMYRIACAASNKLRILVMTLQIIISVNCLVFVLVSMLQCRPLQLYWTLSLKPQNCIDEGTHLVAASIINTSTDFLVVLLPLVIVRIVYAGKLTTRQTIIVNLLFGAGFLATAAGATRTYFTWLVTTQPDVSWHAWLNWLVSCIELFLGIICTSIPATKPFFNKYVPKLLGTVRRSRFSERGGATLTEPITKASAFNSRASSESVVGELAAFPAERKSPATRRFSEATLNKPLPVVAKNQSVYTINIQLDESSLGPADRTRAPGSRIMEQTDLAWRQPPSNFSRPRVYHARCSSDPSSQHRLSLHGPRAIRSESRNTNTTAGESSRYSHILDDVESAYRYNIHEQEEGRAYSPHVRHSYSAVPEPLKKHGKSVSVSTFRG
ncbi:integral membrane protein [Colletotrichum somersetense]|nr:integral membrane protein [Colletotrichum somersetense]